MSSEFRRGWPVLVASGLGIAFGASPIPFNSIGAFIPHLEQEFGWGRGDIQLAIFVFTVVVVLTVPIIGAMADRFGVRPVAIATLAMFGLTFGALAFTPASLIGFYVLWGLMGLLGGGSTPVTWTRAINAWFERNRGLALAIALMGTGVTAAFLPRLAVWLIEQIGWRGAFAGIALLPLAIALPVAIIAFRDRPQAELTHDPASPRPSAIPGVTLRQAVRDYRFWVLAISILLVATGIGGTITNLQPLLIDRGFTAADAASVAGLIGISIVIGRLLAGWLIDRFWAPAVTFPMLVLPGIACLLLSMTEVPIALAALSAIMIGLAAGAETDLVAYLSARYFGLAHYGSIYGVQYAAFGLASGFAPFVFGKVFDVAGTYDPILYTAAGFFVVGALAL
ncbi:MAG TPA: MFS transporter, partial [Steroidobacteraceae bacterium]|nr:MFS transporter [Steroidobacteraceae bacterium]